MQKEKLIIFLRELATDIETKKLDNDRLVDVSKFYMSWTFKEDEGEYSQDELIRYLSLGWYVYTCLLNNSN